MPETQSGQAQGGDHERDKEGDKDKDEDGASDWSGGQDFAGLLLAMERRLATKNDVTNKAVNKAVMLSKLNSDALDTLEEKVDATDAAMKETLARLEEQEERVLARVEKEVQEMVRNQLKEAEFDTQLSVGDLSSIQQAGASYAATAYKAGDSNQSSMVTVTERPISKEDRQEAKFWESRRSLRLWPVENANREGLEDFLRNKLAMDASFVKEDMGQVSVRRVMERRPKNAQEVCVTFETKQVRDLVKAQGPNLATYRDEAGMRLQVPDHLQKNFRALMLVAYDLKKKYPDLRRNIKFDEEKLDMFMDFQLEKEAGWRRIGPDQAARILGGRTRKRSGGPEDLKDDKIKSLMAEDQEKDRPDKGSERQGEETKKKRNMTQRKTRRK